MGTGAVVAIVLGCVFGGIFVIGVLAAVAIPAFMKNTRKAKGIESTMNVKRIYDGARAYYEETGQFPDTPQVSTVPALGSCCGTPRGKCAPDPSLWTDPSWQALRFSMDDPHYYSYRYEKEGSGSSAIFTAGAYGDLDCDTVYSTFELVGSIRADGTVVGGAGFFKDRELE